MSENSGFNPFNTDGADAKQDAYNWGWTVKSVKGANVDVTYGFKTSTTFGVSNTNVFGGYLANYVICYCSNVVGWSYSNVAGAYTQTITGVATKSVWGGEFVHGFGDKVELYDKDCYKMILGKEYKSEGATSKRGKLTKDMEKIATGTVTTVENNKDATKLKEKTNCVTTDHTHGTLTIKVASSMTSTVGAASSETVTGAKSATALSHTVTATGGMITLASAAGKIIVNPSGLVMVKGTLIQLG